MKRISLMILLAAITLSGMAQTIGEAFYIYRNDGQFNAFFRDEVQAIEYSYYDADSVKYEEIVTQVVITADSVYKIPLAAIDSVGFVQPETVYKKDVTYLGNSLIDYITDISGMNISFRLDLPTNLTPKIGDKIATVEMTELFPYGFFGRVNAVEKTSDAIIVKCDTLSLENAVSRFYCSVKMDNHQTSYANKRASNSVNTLKLDFKPIRFPFELPTIMIEKKDVMGLAGEAKGEWYCDSDLEITVNIVKDDDNKVFYYNINIDGTVTDELSLDIVGGASKEAKLTLFSQDFPPTPGGFYGLTFYMDLGLKAELSGELGFGFTWPSTSKLNLDITFYPNNPLATSVIRRFDMMNNNLSTRYFAGKITGKLGAFFGLGIGVLNHGVGKIGGEFELGLKGDVEFLVDYEELGQSDKSTEYYEKVKNQKADLSSYLGTYFVVSFLEGDNTIMKEYDIDEWIKDFSLKYSWGNDWDIAKLYEGYMFPLFEHISLIRDENDKTRADASFVIPYNSIKKCIVGFKLFDSKGQFIAEKFYPEFYSNKAESSPLYPLTFTGLNEKEVYTVYPCIIIDGHEMLATPKFSEDMILPIAEDVQDFDYTSAELTGRVVSNRNPEDLLVYFQYTKVAELIGEKEEWITVEALYDKENQRYHLTLTDLIPATNYKYHLMCNNSGEEIYSEEKTFSTKDYEVTVDDVLIKSPYSATLTGKIGGYNPSRGYVYFYYTTDWTSGIWKEAHADYIESDGIFTAKVDGLTPSTRYFYKLLYVIYENQYESIPFSFVTNDLSTEIPKINNFNQTVAQYIPNGFEYKQKSYSFRYNCEVALEWNKADNCDDCGYVYEDIEGDTVHVSLKTFASPYSDSRYVYYRNEPISHATLYGYVKYIGDDNFYHGEKTDYPLIYDKQPVATTLEPTYVDETSAKVKCGFKEVAPWGGTCGIEYWEDTNDKDSKKIYFETAQEEIEVTLNDLKPGTIYYYQAFIKVGDEFIMAEEVKHFTTQSAMANLCPDDKHPHLIDLGLQSGTKWACCNVGAASPADYGGYFAWGETQAREEFTWGADYALYNTTTFDFDYIGEDIAGTKYDAATANWGDSWQMPNRAQCKELFLSCSYMVKNMNGIDGWEFTGPNGGKIFIPFAGTIEYTRNDWSGYRGFYWTSNNYDSNSVMASGFIFDKDWRWNVSGVEGQNDGHIRCYGETIRPVQPGITVTTGDATEITVSSATLHGSCSKGISTAGFSVKKEGESEYVQYNAYPDEEGNFSATIEDLDIETKYVYYAFVQTDEKTYKGEELSLSTKPLCPDSNHPHMIDLGLPSGTKWACCNVGASRPEENGNYYAWGDSSEKTEFDIDSYLYQEYSEIAKTVICSYIGEDISGTEYDIALQKWGNPWCMPSKDDYEELIANCKIYEVTYKGEKGTLFVAPNGKHVFMKPQGYRDCCDLHGTEQGVYWTSTYSHVDSVTAEWAKYINAYAFQFMGDYVYINGEHSRVYGYAVRPIAK